MKRLLFFLAASSLLASCGIETVAVLPSPNIDYLDQSTTEAMEFTHDANLYSGTDFLGYEIYYRVYPAGSPGPVQLAKDATTLDAGPLTTLQGMGYKALAASSSQEADFVNDTLQVTDPGDGDVISLDFSDFLDSSNTAETNVQPRLKINGVTASYVYRTTALSGTVANLQKFGTLRTDGSTRTDTSSSSTSKTYEVEVFVVAYGMTSTIESVYSTPKAWGTIQYISP